MPLLFIKIVRIYADPELFVKLLINLNMKLLSEKINPLNKEKIYDYKLTVTTISNFYK